MTTEIVTTLVRSSKNAPRIWLEGAKLEREGFRPNQGYMVEVSGNTVTLRTDTTTVTPETFISGTVSRRMRGEKELPLVELRHSKLFEIFEEGQKLLVVVEVGKIVITAHEQENRVREREAMFNGKLASGEMVVVNSVFHGSGVMDSALHDGLLRQGIKTVLGIAVEKEDKYLDNSLTNNSHIWDEFSMAVNCAIEDLEGVPQADLVFMGIPCIGASVAGRSKKGTQYAEQCESSGMLIYFIIDFVRKSNPAVAVFECVKPYASTVSAHLLRSVLVHLGYQLDERTFNGNEFGALENRNRWVLLATSRGITAPQLESVQPLYEKQATLAECLDDIPANDPQWRGFDYLKSKEISDKEKGSCFARQMFTDDSDHVNTITREYQKARSSDCFHRHPTDPELSRLYTPEEHARFKRVPLRLISGLAKTTAHEVLGQSVIYSVF